MNSHIHIIQYCNIATISTPLLIPISITHSSYPEPIVCSSWEPACTHSQPSFDRQARPTLLSYWVSHSYSIPVALSLFPLPPPLFFLSSLAQSFASLPSLLVSYTPFLLFSLFSFIIKLASPEIQADRRHRCPLPTPPSPPAI